MATVMFRNENGKTICYSPELPGIEGVGADMASARSVFEEQIQDPERVRTALARRPPPVAAGSIPPPLDPKYEPPNISPAPVPVPQPQALSNGNGAHAVVPMRLEQSLMDDIEAELRTAVRQIVREIAAEMTRRVERAIRSGGRPRRRRKAR